MKGIIFAAGLGTRMGDLTKDTPKCLLFVGEERMLDRWIDELLTIGCDEITFNTHHHAAQVRHQVAYKYWREIVGGKLREFHEPELLGTAVTLKENRRSLTYGFQGLGNGKHGPVVIVYCDVFRHGSRGIKDLVAWHILSGGPATIGVYDVPDASECGVVEVDGEHVTKITEKPGEPKGNTVWAGVAVIDSSALWHLDELTEGQNDIATHFLPILAEKRKLKAYRVEGFCDVGSAERYAVTQEAYK